MKFKPGQSGNPGGRPKLPEDIKEARKLNKVEFERILNKYIHMTGPEIKAVMKDPGTPALDMMILRLIRSAARIGSLATLDFVLDRLIGKVAEPVELSGSLSFTDLIKRAHKLPKDGK